MAKIRLDVMMVELGLAESRSQAQRLVMAGKVRVNGELALKPAVMLASGTRVTVDSGPPFVSRGGEKLEAALKAFTIEIRGRTCADVGASTGGFSDCLLQNGASRVYAIDVGKGILHWKLRQDPRVTVMEETNARFIERLPEPVEVVTVDTSFISLKTLLPVFCEWFDASGSVVALIKPQFEAGRAEAARGDGVIRDPAVHRRVLQDITSFALETGYEVKGLLRSPLTGPKGNAEFLVWLDWNPDWTGEVEIVDLEMLIEAVFGPAS